MIWFFQIIGQQKNVNAEEHNDFYKAYTYSE